MPLLSLILCSRNDAYMGNSRWRLETALNYAADRIEAAGRSQDVEVLVADWGSEVPLRDVVRLSPAAARLVSFLLIPPDVARPLQKDSPFAEVYALNAAVRRASGTYIGRIDQDTLIGPRFLDVFFDLVEGRRQLAVPLERALLYSNRRAIAYRFVARSPAYRHVVTFMRRFGGRCPLETLKNEEFWTYYVGIWLAHRDVWHECGGYDERYIYYNWMEVEMILRLRQRYTLIDFGRAIDYDFYHLGHRNPRGKRTRRDLGHRVNQFELDPEAPALAYHPNPDGWGLADVALPAGPGGATPPPPARWFDPLVFSALILDMGAQRAIDWLVTTTRRWKGSARRRLA